MHARGQLQAEFEEWVASRGPWTGIPATDPLTGDQVPGERLLERLRGCADAMSPGTCRTLRLEPESSYAEGVEALVAGVAPAGR